MLCCGGARAGIFSRSTRSDGGFAAVAEGSGDLACPLCGLCDDDTHTDTGGLAYVSSSFVKATKMAFMLPVCELCRRCGGRPCRLATRRLLSGRRRTWSAASVPGDAVPVFRGVGGASVSSLSRRSPSCKDSQCAKGPTAYSALVRFHADGAAPEPRCLHGRAPPAVMVPVPFRTTSDIKTCAIVISIACAGGKTQMGSCSACFSAHQSWAKRGFTRT